MFLVSFEPVAGGKGLESIMVEPHPVHRTKWRVGYCRPPETGWSLIDQHHLRESDIPLLEDYVERHLADQRANLVGERPETD